LEQEAALEPEHCQRGPFSGADKPLRICAWLCRGYDRFIAMPFSYSIKSLASGEFQDNGSCHRVRNWDFS
jgi:hypothetical protein